MKNSVLVAVVNREKDLEIALKHHWYRIPTRYAPKRKARYLALYQTRVFPRKGKSINFYAPIKNYSLVYRRVILPEEEYHPRSNEQYQKLSLGSIRKTPRRIRNKTAIRINFGFTTLEKLLHAKEIRQIFNIAPLEQIMYTQLRMIGIETFRQYCIMKNGHCRYRLDLAIFCKYGKIDIECDNEKWHHQPRRRKNDRKRNRWLKLHGWNILRFSGNEIINNTFMCIEKIKNTIRSLGGLSFRGKRGCASLNKMEEK